MRKPQAQEAYLAAYDLYADAVYRLCYFKTGSKEEAADMTQEVFTRVWESSATKEIHNPRAFLFTVARNLIKDYYKKKKPVLERDLPEGMLLHVPGEGENEEEKSERSLVLSALTELPDPYREVLTLHFVEGIPVGDIASMLHERPNTISVRLKRGIEKMRECLHIEPHTP